MASSANSVAVYSYAIVTYDAVYSKYSLLEKKKPFIQDVFSFDNAKSKKAHKARQVA